MMGLLVLEILTLVSMFASLFAVLFNPGHLYGVMATGGYYFVITLCVYALSERKNVLRWGYVLLFAPLLYFGPSPYYILMPVVVTYYMIKEKDFGKVDFKYFIKSFYGLLVSIYLILSVFEVLFPEFLTDRLYNYWQMPLFFFLCSIQFLRLLRFTEVGMQSAYIRKQNARFALFSIFVYITAVYDSFREAITSWLGNGVMQILHFFMKPIYAFMENDGQVELPENIPLVTNEQSMGDNVLNSVLPGETVPHNESAVQVLSSIVDVFSVILLISLFAFVVYKLIKGFKRSSKQVVSDQLVIERTMIVKKKEKKKKRRWQFSRDKKEEIRHLYYKHMEKLDVLDETSCTTQYVYEEGVKSAVQNPLDIRDIYRTIRYNPQVTLEDAKDELERFKKALK